VIPFQDASFYAAPGQAGATASAISAGLIGVVGFFSLVFVAMGLMREAARRARAAKVAETKAENRQLAPGYAILYGEVETGDALPAVSVRIRQVGRDYHVKNGMRHTWTEFERHVDARPFFLRLPSGDRVKVVPGEDVHLVDVLGTDEATGGSRGASSPPVRVRTAALSAKDVAYACGRLVSPETTIAYRSIDEGYSLHPPPGGKMLLSAEPLEQRYALRARFHRGWLVACVAALLFTNGVLFGTFWMEFLWGRPVAGYATQARTWTTSGKHGPITHYGVDADVTVDGHLLRVASETCYAYYGSVKADLAASRPVRVPFVVVPFHTQTLDIGTQATLNILTCIFGWFILSGVAGGYFLHTKHTRPWYERKKVIDTGSGPLGFPDRLA
jgi:hypothetical protein